MKRSSDGWKRGEQQSRPSKSVSDSLPVRGCADDRRIEGFDQFFVFVEKLNTKVEKIGVVGARTAVLLREENGGKEERREKEKGK
jgi:hypothetical protein